MKRGSALRRVVVAGVSTLAVFALCSAVALAGEYTGAFCVWMGNPGPATLADGPVSIGTDHAVYPSTTEIEVTVTNHLGHPIWLVSPNYSFTHNSCAGYFFRQQRAGQWTIDGSTCVTGEGPQRDNKFAARVAAGSSFATIINVTRDVRGLAMGTYRLGYGYVFSDPATRDPAASYDAIVRSATLIYSPPFRVCACARCA